MAGSALMELKQSKSLRSTEEAAFITLQRTADALMQRIADLLKPHGLSPTQYNVLRILRGAGPGGLACGEIGQRMITRDPDITRLLDRLEKLGLTVRTREQKDRRVITSRITRDGLGVLESLDGPMATFHRQALGHLGEKKLRNLIRLLESAQGGA